MNLSAKKRRPVVRKVRLVNFWSASERESKPNNSTHASINSPRPRGFFSNISNNWSEQLGHPQVKGTHHVSRQIVGVPDFEFQEPVSKLRICSGRPQPDIVEHDLLAVAKRIVAIDVE